MIITVTLNPAVDEEYVVPEFRPGGWFRASETNRSAGGKGVNVSLILSQLGYSSAAMGFLAGFNGEFIRDELRKKRITTNFVHVRGETRTNVYIVDEIGHVETGITESGPYIPEGALARFLNNYDRMLTRAKFVYIGGSLPPGAPQDIYRELVVRAKNKGIVTLVDAAGPSLMEALEVGPSIAKIDRRFINQMAGIPLTSLDSLISLVSKVHEYGVEWATTSYRAYGEVFFTPKGVYLAEFGRKGLVSMFGAGEALMAGLIVGFIEGMDVEDVIRFSMACAWEDALHIEKGVSSREKVEDLMKEVALEKIS